MAQSMKKVVKLGSELSTEERNLLSTAYKHAVGGRRFSRCIISSIDKKTIDSAKKHHVKEYREPVKNELRGMCNEVLNLLGNFLVPHARDHEPRAFFLKMKEDYYRYLAPRSPLAETGSVCCSGNQSVTIVSFSCGRAVPGGLRGRVPHRQQRDATCAHPFFDSLSIFLESSKGIFLVDLDWP